MQILPAGGPHLWYGSDLASAAGCGFQWLKSQHQAGEEPPTLIGLLHFHPTQGLTAAPDLRKRAARTPWHGSEVLILHVGKKQRSQVAQSSGDDWLW